MVKTEDRNSKRRRVFLWIFLLSTGLFFVLIGMLALTPLRRQQLRPTEPVAVEPTPSEAIHLTAGATQPTAVGLEPTVTAVASESPVPMPGEAPSLLMGNQVALVGGVLGALGSCLTSFVTFTGLVWTMILGWRKESRDAKDAELERQRLALELEKQRLDLEKAKAEEDTRHHRR
jgi:hypothetical protein